MGKTNVVRKIWDTTCKERFKGIMEEERSLAKKHFGVNDIVECEGYNEGWIRVDIWDRLVDNVWNTEASRNHSQNDKQNRQTEKYGSITKHTRRSILFLLHVEMMATQLNRKPTYGEVYNRTHKCEQGHDDYVDNKSKSARESYTSSMSQKYSTDESCHPKFDLRVWCDAIGGMETTRTQVYGFGTTPCEKILFSPSICTGEASYSPCSPLVETPRSSAEVDRL
ncbi:putative transposase, Ptta/En/Spm, plant [Dioscorea sansibarensis]